LTQPTAYSTTVEAALKWSTGVDEVGLRERLSRRREPLTAGLGDLVASRELYRNESKFSEASLMGYRRAELHLRAELAWHDELDGVLPRIAAESASRVATDVDGASDA
jgi:hypothetical protein